MKRIVLSALSCAALMGVAACGQEPADDSAMTDQMAAEPIAPEDVMTADDTFVTDEGAPAEDGTVTGEGAAAEDSATEGETAPTM